MLTQLPDVVIDLILQRYVTADDLRSVHQVSTSWRDMINSRQLVNQKRLAHVSTLRSNKENIIPGKTCSSNTRTTSSSRTSSRGSSTDSLQLANVRKFKLKKYKPFRELNENENTSSATSDGDNSNSNSSTNASPSPLLLRLRSNNHQNLNSQPCKNTSDPDSTSPTTMKLGLGVNNHGLGNVKTKAKASLRRIANI